MMTHSSSSRYNSNESRLFTLCTDHNSIVVNQLSCVRDIGCHVIAIIYIRTTFVEDLCLPDGQSPLLKVAKVNAESQIFRWPVN